MREKLIAANWKEHPRDLGEALRLFGATAKIAAPKGVRVAVCAPSVYLERLAAERTRTRAKHIALGAQDVFYEEEGAYTGAVGPRMLVSLGVEYAIVGHSERRRFAHETDGEINLKIKAALAADLKVILCVGEPRAVRRQGTAAARKFVAAQLAADLSGVRAGKKGSVAVAYEPIWAIGTGRNDPPEDAAMMADFIRMRVRVRNQAKPPLVLYGGSVDGKNAAAYAGSPHIDGALVGGASLHAAEFGKIVAAAGRGK